MRFKPPVYHRTHIPKKRVSIVTAAGAEWKWKVLLLGICIGDQAIKSLERGLAAFLIPTINENKTSDIGKQIQLTSAPMQSDLFTRKLVRSTNPIPDRAVNLEFAP